MKKLTFTLLSIASMMYAHGTYAQYVSPYKQNSKGEFVIKTSQEMSAEEAKYNANRAKYEPPIGLARGNKRGSNGEVVIGGYVRYRHPRGGMSKYNTGVSESTYITETYPADTIHQIDNFNGNCTIPWAANTYDAGDKQKCLDLQKRIPGYVNDGLPFIYYDSLQKLSWFGKAGGNSNSYNEGRTYEFSRAVHYWVKRKEGSKNIFIKFGAEFAFTCGDDNVYFEVNDKGQYKIDAVYYNWETNHKVVETGKTDNWESGGWNKITIAKDEYNTVSFFINDDYLYHYQIPDMPITTRFSAFNLEMPYEWQKKGLQYNVGEVLVECYPKIK